MKEKACALDFDDTLELREPIGRGERMEGKISYDRGVALLKDKVMAGFFSYKQFVELVEGGGVP